MLGDPPLFKSLDEKHPIDQNVQVQPASIDLRLSTTFLKFKKELLFLDCLIEEPENMEELKIKETEPVILRPNEFILGQTLEEIHLPPNFFARIVARQSIARLGILINLATFMNPGYKGIIPLQIKNLTNKTVVLRPNIRICSAIIEKLDIPPQISYDERPDAKYQNEQKVAASKLSQDIELRKKAKPRENLKKLLNEHKIKTIDKEFKYFNKIYDDIIYLIISEVFYLSKIFGRDQPSNEDIEEGSKNIRKILKKVFEGM